jgi:hypothetical protein
MSKPHKFATDEMPAPAPHEERRCDIIAGWLALGLMLLVVLAGFVIDRAVPSATACASEPATAPARDLRWNGGVAPPEELPDATIGVFPDRRDRDADEAL